MIRRFLASLMVLLGLVVFLVSGFALFGADALQKVYLPLLPTLDRARPAPAPHAREALPGDPIGVIEIPRLGVSSVVLEGEDTAALLLGVGHLSDTPLPWNGGNTAFAAHRDTFFRPLAGIRHDDVITFSTAHD